MNRSKYGNQHMNNQTVAIITKDTQ